MSYILRRDDSWPPTALTHHIHLAIFYCMETKSRLSDYISHTVTIYHFTNYAPMAHVTVPLSQLKCVQHTLLYTTMFIFGHQCQWTMNYLCWGLKSSTGRYHPVWIIQHDVLFVDILFSTFIVAHSVFISNCHRMSNIVMLPVRHHQCCGATYCIILYSTWVGRYFRVLLVILQFTLIQAQYIICFISIIDCTNYCIVVLYYSFTVL